MEFLIQALDGEPGTARPPALPPLPAEVTPESLQDAVAFLRRTSLPIEPRRRWPTGGMPRYDARGLIPEAYRAEPGKALCIWGDAGWGGLVGRGKYRDGRFSDELVRACASLLVRWAPQPAPVWVTCIPSRRHPDLVPDFAERLALQLGLPFHRTLEQIEDRAEQKSMANGTQQARNVDGSLAVSQDPLARWPGTAGGRHGGFALDVDGRRVVAALARKRRGVAARPCPFEPRPMTAELSFNAQAILLLTAPLIAGRGKSSLDPLTAGEYRRFARRLRELQRAPADLLDPGARTLLKECRFDSEPERIERLLGRGFLLSQAVERWRTRAIWVVSRADAAYPQRLKKRLGEDAPPILYGCGDATLLDGGGLAVVGSRNVDDTLVEYTEKVGRLTAVARRVVISGGARGIDQAAMRGALEANGNVVGILADGLEKAAVRREHREALMDRRLALICPYDPAARFNVGHAMQRNKLIYASADAALVVNSDYK